MLRDSKKKRKPDNFNKMKQDKFRKINKSVMGNAKHALFEKILIFEGKRISSKILETYIADSLRAQGIIPKKKNYKEYRSEMVSFGIDLLKFDKEFIKKKRPIIYQSECKY